MQRFVERLPHVDAIQILPENLEEVRQRYNLIVVIPPRENHRRIYFEGGIGDGVVSCRMGDWIVSNADNRYGPQYQFMDQERFHEVYVPIDQSVKNVVRQLTHQPSAYTRIDYD
jgi:hypothetical protein